MGLEAFSTLPYNKRVVKGKGILCSPNTLHILRSGKGTGCYCQKNIASATGKSTAQLIVATVKQILHMKELIKSQTKIMAKQCSLPGVDLVKTFIGISDFSAIGLILQIQTVEQFSSVKKLASFFGLHPVFKISGDGSSGFHMNKKGRREPRQILFMVALYAIQTNPIIRSIYLERIQKGMNKIAAIGVCMHKILRIIYGMLKHSKAFDQEIDRKNREKTFCSKKKAFMNKNRCYQAFDPKAPISRRQKKKRREREESHSDNDTKNGIIAPCSQYYFNRFRILRL